MAFTGYEDIAPALSNIFASIRSSTALSDEAKDKTINDYFTKSMAIEEAKNKLADQSIAREMNMLNLDRARSVLSDTQIERQRKESQLAAYGNTKQIVSGIMNTDASAEQKRQAIARAAIDTDAAANPFSSNLIDMSLKTLSGDKDPLQNQWADYGKAVSSVDYVESASGMKDPNKLAIKSELELDSYIRRYHPEKVESFTKLPNAQAKIALVQSLTPTTTAAKKASTPNIGSYLPK